MKGPRFRYWRSKGRGMVAILLLTVCFIIVSIPLLQTNQLFELITHHDKGLPIMLPPKLEEQENIKIKERNIFNIIVNSNDLILVEEEIMSLDEIKDAAKKFITNEGKNPNSSESPQKAIISFQTDRGTSYDLYIAIRDQLKLAYAELRAEYLNLSLEEYYELKKNRKLPEYKEAYDSAKKAYPEMISDAEPSDVN